MLLSRSDASGAPRRRGQVLQTEDNAGRMPRCSEISPPPVWYKKIPIRGGGLFRNITVAKSKD
eukprot:2113366-Rhodomonas_salina.1